MKLSRSIVLLVFAVAAVPMLLLLSVTTLASRRALLAGARQLVVERADRLRLRVGDRLDGTLEALDAEARQTRWQELPDDGRLRKLHEILAQREDLLAVGLLDPEGHPLPGLAVTAPGGDPGLPAAEAEAAGRVLADVGRTTFGPIARDAAGRGRFIPLVAPLPDRLLAHGKARVGYLTAAVSLAGIDALLAQRPYDDGTEALLVDPDGTLIAARGPLAAPELAAVRTFPIVQALARDRAGLEQSQEVRTAEFEMPKGAAAIGAYATVPTAGWGVVVEQPKARVLSLVRWVQREGVLGLALGLLLSVVLGVLFARSIVGPLRRVVAEALDISRGIFGREIKLGKRNELGDLVHTFNYMSKQLQAYDSENRGLYETLEKGYLETIVALANSVDSKDSYTRGHSQRVADLSVAVGQELKLPDRTLKHLFYGGILHDIGKIGIPDRILLKQAVLSDDEMKVMREHPVIGAAIVEPVAFLAPAAPCVRHHHERWDGNGYPDKLKGTSIPLVARIVNAADTWDACTSTRPYQAAMGYEEALAVVRRLSGAQFDPDVVEAMVRALEKWRAAGRPVVAAAGGERPRLVVSG
ncbi:MAG TPA: HD domain-containing phosphohydrolase [Myxococcales bacterium]|nr:HD domain-containing phosphohydrolase [Myxococcales bacterium]